MRFLITGASGFVGRTLCDFLLQKGHDVIAASRNRSINITGARAFVVNDWLDIEAWKVAMRDVDVVIHLAARVHVMKDTSSDPIQEFRSANVLNTEVLAKASAASNVKKFIFLSTIHVNGTESLQKPFTENDPPNPREPYAQSKLEAELLLMKFFEGTPTKLVILRPALVYGPGVSGNILALLKFLKASKLLPFQSFSNRRSMIYVGNLADLIHRFSVKANLQHNLYVLSDNQDKSVGDFTRMFSHFLPGAKLMVSFPIVLFKILALPIGKSKELHKLTSDLIVDPSRTVRELDWIPEFKIELGIQKTVEWFLSGVLNSRKKVLVVSQYFWPEHFVINSLCTELTTRGYEVTVLTGLPNYPKGSIFSGYHLLKGPWTETYGQVSIKRVPLMPRKRGFIFLSLNYLSFVLFGIIPGAFRIRKDFDIIFCMGVSPATSCIPAIFLKWWTGKPLIYWVQDLWPESVQAVGAIRSRVILNFLGKIVDFIYKNCDLILVQSEAFRPSIRARRVANEKIVYIPNWAKPSPSVSKLPDWLLDVPRGFKVVFAGNIGKAQDMGTVISAAHLLKDYKEIKWIIVGDGSSKADVDNQIETFGLRESVYTYGRRPHEDMPALLSIGDVMLVSLTNEYIFSLTVPSKVQGYMASAKPIVASLNGEGARIVRDAGAGMSCPSESPEQLAETILKMFNMADLERVEMGNKGHAYFLEHFDEFVVISKIQFLIEQLTATKTQGAIK